MLKKLLRKNVLFGFGKRLVSLILTLALVLPSAGITAVPVRANSVPDGTIDAPFEITVLLKSPNNYYSLSDWPVLPGEHKYLYWDPAFSDLIGIRWSNGVEEYELGQGPVFVPDGETTFLYVKRVEDFLGGQFGAKEIYYKVRVVGPVKYGEVYLESVAGQQINVQGGAGTIANPFTATIYVPFGITSITRTNNSGAPDFKLTGDIGVLLFRANANFNTTQTGNTKALIIGENIIYAQVQCTNTQAQTVNFHYTITVIRGILPDFIKTTQSLKYNPGGEIAYTISATLPSSMASIEYITIIDEYPSELSYKAGSAELKIGGSTIPFANGTTIDSSTPGTLTVSIDRTTGYDFSGDKGKTIELTLTFDVAPDASQEITNKAFIEFNGENVGTTEIITEAEEVPNLSDPGNVTVANLS